MQNKPRKPRPGHGPRQANGSFNRPAVPRARGKPAPRGNANPRRVAVKCWTTCWQKDAYAALSLDDRLNAANLNQLDKRFCASIVYRTLENLYPHGFRPVGFFLKDADSLEPTVRDILRISACQLLFHDRIPASAVVDEAVKLTRGAGLEGLSGMANAVLRSPDPEARTKSGGPRRAGRALSVGHVFHAPMAGPAADRRLRPGGSQGHRLLPHGEARRHRPAHLWPGKGI